jgi:hypothetical protein
MELHSFEIQSHITRKGKSAAKITLRTGDVIEPANDSSLASERDELQEADYLFSDEKKRYEYRFSLYIPDSFPIVSTRLIIAQWKQKCPSEECSDNSPILAIRYQSGKLFITLNSDSGRRKLFELKNDCRNRWLDFRFQILFSQQSNGEIDAFLNDSSIISYRGKTCYSQKPGYNLKNNKFYFKMGLYRDRMSEPMSIYMDEYEKKELTPLKETAPNKGFTAMLAEKQ